MATVAGIDSKAIGAFLVGGVLVGGVVWFANRPAPPPPPAEVVAEVREVPAETHGEQIVEVEKGQARSTPLTRPKPAPAKAATKPDAKPTPVASSGTAPAATAPVYRAPESVASSAPEPEPRYDPPIATPRYDPPIATPAKKREPNRVTIPGGTALSVRLGDRISSETNAVGDTFEGTLDKALVVDGLVLAEKGSRVNGKVASLFQGGRVKGVAEIHLELTELRTSDGQNIKITSDSFVKQAETSKADDAKKVGIGAGIGAAIGAIAGGGKGAAIGAGIGGAAGAGTVIATRGKSAEIPAETLMTFHLGSAVTVTEKLDN